MSTECTAKRTVFITGGTGFMGRQLISELLRRGHGVRAFVRPGSERKLPAGCEVFFGDPLSAAAIHPHISPADTFVQLVGTSHPSPAKGAQFRAVDFNAGRAGADAAASSGIQHFVYVSVAHPAPIMHSYIAVRSDVEAHIQRVGLNATILRPWYVLGPGRRWPTLIKPIYALMETIPASRASAQRLGLVTDAQMNAALVHAVENPAVRTRIVEVPQIRQAKL